MVCRKTNLVQRHDEWGFPHLQQIDGLDGLRFKPVHQVHHQNGNVAQPAPPRSQIAERLVTWTLEK